MSHKRVRIILCGLGTVGKAFFRLLSERSGQITRKYGLSIEVAAVVDVGGAAVSDQGSLPVADLLMHVDAGGRVERFSSHGRPGLSGVEALSAIPAEVLVETTPTNLVDGEPARGHIFAALGNGMDVVSANKGPLVLSYREIRDLAREKGRRVFMSAAAAAALPTLDVGLICLAGIRLGCIRSVKGVIIIQLLVSIVGFGRLFELYSSNFLMEHMWALLMVLFFFAFLIAEGLGMLERRFEYYAASRGQ